MGKKFFLVFGVASLVQIWTRSDQPSLRKTYPAPTRRRRRTTTTSTELGLQSIIVVHANAEPDKQEFLHNKYSEFWKYERRCQSGMMMKNRLIDAMELVKNDSAVLN